MIVFSNLLSERSHIKGFFIGRISLPFSRTFSVTYHIFFNSVLFLRCRFVLVDTVCRGNKD